MTDMNVILATDSYKLSHWRQYPEGTERVFSYFESRQGATFDYTVFFGLQHILKGIAGRVVTRRAIEEASEIADIHFGAELFNREGWEYILEELYGKLPLRIKAVPEGTVVPTGNVLMTVENTDPNCYWLTNALESLLTHVWYPSTVSTLSRTTKEIISLALERSGASQDALPYMLHDFGYRGATCHEAAAIGGAAHLVNFCGTDTLPALQLARDSYGAELETLGFSVPATEHSVMTALGREGEMEIVERLLEQYPTGVISIVADSYNIYEFVRRIATELRDKVLARDGVLVVRPDSVTQQHPTPALEVKWLAEFLYASMGGEENEKGMKVIDPHIRLLWGDGIDQRGIQSVLYELINHGFSAENIATFGMGGGLLQKVNRDTQRFAFKSSAQMRGGEWHDVRKEPLDTTKTSKAGRLELWRNPDGCLTTIPLDAVGDLPLEGEPVLRTVFEDGRIPQLTTFEEVRKRAEL